MDRIHTRTLIALVTTYIPTIIGLMSYTNGIKDGKDRKKRNVKHTHINKIKMERKGNGDMVTRKTSESVCWKRENYRTSETDPSQELSNYSILITIVFEMFHYAQFVVHSHLAAAIHSGLLVNFAYDIKIDFILVLHT